MDQYITSKLRKFFFTPDRNIKAIFLILILFGISLSATSSISANDYWLDELNSVTTSKLNIRTALPVWLTETGPPFYRFVLALWIRATSDNEITTRLLSFAFTCLATVIIFRALRGFGERSQQISTLLIATNSLAIFAANEVRPYALVLLLATICTGLFIQTKISRYKLLILLGCTLLLSITHYIGFIYASILLFVLLIVHFRNRTNTLLTLLTLALLTIWPIIQATFGGLLNKAGGNFWISVGGPLDTLQIYSSAVVPADHKIRVLIGIIIFFVSGWFTTKEAFFVYKNKILPTDDIALVKLNSLIFLFLIVVIAFDLHSPVSTPRNSIILVPAICIWFALIYNKIDSKYFTSKIFFLSIFLIVTANLIQGFRSVEEKKQPLQNWSASAQFVIDHRITEPIFCFGGADYTRISNYYLKKLSGGKLEALPIRQPITTLKGPAYILYGNYGGDPAYEWLKTKAALHDGVEQYIPAQHYKNGAEAGVFFIQAIGEPASK